MNLRALLGCIFFLAIPLEVSAQQVIVVDNDHLHLSRPDARPSLSYQLSAASTIVLDARKYEFKIPTQLAGKSLNSIQVIAGKDLQYSSAWNDAGIATLSSATLRANSGSPPFTTFASGQHLVIAIGNLDGTDFNVVWVGMADIK